MHRLLGDDWHKLPPALQAHYRWGAAVDRGAMDIEFPRFMRPWLWGLRRLGALIDRPGAQVQTTVSKSVAGERQQWQRTMTYADGQTATFNSVMVHAGGNQLIEFINPVLGLRMAVHLDDAGRLHYRGVHMVIQLGRVRLPVPEWLALGHTTIVEEAVDERRFAMDFRVTHPLLGQVYRYAGEFEADAGDATDASRASR
jgi:hypothetical protein